MRGTTPGRPRRSAPSAPGILLAALCATTAPAAPAAHQPSEILGTWRGTSTCADRVLAPACHDEVVVYEFTIVAKTDTVHWKADKIVEGRRELMYEIDLSYDPDDACWAAEFSSPRARGRWCLSVAGAHLTGTGRLLPGKELVRRIDALKQ